MDISSGSGYPTANLSNFTPHPFVFEGVECNSMEGLLQSFKFSNPDMQVEVCQLVGRAAKSKGKKKKWWREQNLFWKGEVIPRESERYQQLLDGAFEALATNTKFCAALKATGQATLGHSIGKKNPKETVLTVREFCRRLSMLRDTL